ncbi:MAG: branched-chain amino acid transport system permease protein, partial [Rhodospirillaceae bacterium]|nr:branched-chain amino acid transport system permease protein [Rhodospirillaceae bacterium]
MTRGQTIAAQALARRARWRVPEIVFWVLAFAALFLPPGKHLLLNEVAILALFALSLDLILGYAGIISLGHAAFFGTGAYAAGLFCKLVTPDPLAGLVAAIAAAALLGL